MLLAWSAEDGFMSGTKLPFARATAVGASASWLGSMKHIHDSNVPPRVVPDFRNLPTNIPAIRRFFQ